MAGFFRSLFFGFGRRDELRSPERLKAALERPEDGIFLVDVRTAGEYASGHIPGATNIPYDEIGDKPPTSAKDATIVVYCHSGSRSGAARSILQSKGYTKVTNFGAIHAWPYETNAGTNP